jgi:excisionase family DNA binding protein
MNKNTAIESSATARPTELVNVNDAARFLAVSPSTLYGWVWQRRISFVKVGRAVRFDMADLERFVARNRIQARQAGEF